METTTRKGTLSDAINMVPTMEIIEYFGVPYKIRRGKIYILCPNPDHDDRHFGSCYVDKNDDGYYCYPCGAHVNKWNMVLQLNGNNKADACEWFFKMSGIDPTEERREDPYKKVVQVIHKLEAYMQNKPIHNDLHVCDKVDSSYGRNINGEYLYSELSVTNPLLGLYKSNKKVFKKVVTQLLEQEIKKIEKNKTMYDSKKEDFLYIDSVGLVPYDELSVACVTVKQNIQNLIDEVLSL